MLNLAGYQQTELLYTGTRTLVYRAIHLSDAQSVIIKVLRNPHPTFNELVQFRNQYVITRNLEQPHIVQPLALQRYDNGYALVMPDEGAISLASYWQNAAHELRELLNIAIQLAEALHILAGQQIIHKDIKPANILIHPQTQQIQLIDFSIASLLPKEQRQLVNPKGLEGTLAYISPEQTGRMNRGIDYRSDFYSLGVTLYELLVGTVPFTKEEPLELIHAHIAQVPMSPGDLLNAQGLFHPQALSGIILKLMAKNAEDRYQSALGFKHDLERCLQSLDSTGEIADFELGERDMCDRFLIPEKLYGREAEVQTLLDAFERVASPPTSRGQGTRSQGGRAEMLLVVGFSGIGKTAVVNEVHKPIVRQQGYFIKGKFDQFNRNIPFSAFVQALRDLMGQLLGEADAELQTWKAQILEAVGESGQVLIEVIPELERVIGVQPPVPELSGTAAQNRFNRLFEQFTAVFTTPEHPLVMFLDDLQWADSASLNLMKVLMADRETSYLLLLGAYRDNEVFPAHPLMRMLTELEKQEAAISTITLAPLSEQQINQLVAETLSCNLEIAMPLTKLVYRKTQGNPFFTTQFLKGLYEDKLITFNRELGYWQCDLAQVHAAALTNDVVAFMAGRLLKLPQATQDVLKLAACIGNQFDLETLAVVKEAALEESAADIWCALQEGLVIPTSQSYKFFQSAIDTQLSQDETVGYRFLHDRIQQAAYSLIPEAQKQKTHLTIGRLLLGHTSEKNLDDKVFEITNNLNYGIELIDDQREKTQIATLNLRAAHKAKKSTAYAASANYLSFGIQLLKENGWHDNYLLMFDLHKECAESEYLQGDLGRSEIIANKALERARSAIEKIEIYNILIVQYTVTAQYQKAIDFGRIALNLLEIQWQDDQLKQDLEQELQSAKEQLGDREISALIDCPEMVIPEKRSAIEILHNLLPATFSVHQALWCVLVVKMVNLSLQYGHIAECCFGYSFYGVLVNSMFGDYKSGHEFGILSLNLSRKFKDLAQESKACNILAAFLLHWQQPIHYCETINERGYEAGLESGQLQFIGYITYNRILSLFHSGKNLDGLLTEFSTYLPLLEKIKHYYSYDILVGCQLAISSLTSIPLDESPGAIKSAQEHQYFDTCRSRDSFPGICIYQILKAQILYLFYCPQKALEALLSAQELIQFIDGHFTIAEYSYYHSLSLLGHYKSASCVEQAKILDQVQNNQKQLRMWAEGCPENFQHKVNLVEAEVAQNRQEQLLALEMYDRAIVGAKENQFIQDEALANELAAKFYVAWGKEKIASIYMQEAYYCYARWGAKAKTDHLKSHYPELLTPILQKQQDEFDAIDSLTSLTQTLTATLQSQTQSSASLSEALDFAAILQAAQKLSSTIELDELLGEMAEIILTNAGAQKIALLIPDGEQWQLQATAEQIENGKIVTKIPAQRLTPESLVPIRLIQYVKNTQEPVLISKAKTEMTGILEGYLPKHQPQSVLCVPLLNQGNLVAIAYLEHPTTKGVFIHSRQTIVEFLCAQAAVALQNAQLYQRAQLSQAKTEQALVELQQTQIQLVQSEKMSALGSLVAGVAHEINNPVGFLKGNIQPAQDYVQDLFSLIDFLLTKPQDDSQIQTELEAIDLDFVRDDLPKLIGSMNAGVDRIRNISDSLRTFSRKDQDHQTAFNIHDGLESTLLILKHRTKANEQRPQIQILKNYSELPEVQCFPGQLNQVFMNILANAIDAFDEANQEKTYQDIEKNPNFITIQTSVVDEQVQIQIQDNGCGMNSETVEQVFEQGFTTKGVGKGTGLGMAIAHQIITEKHNGTIECSSETGQGTTFTLTLPLTDM
ncbi:MAG: AAA family ATPase [Spirulina sp. SIO3F2]|nr:AAA family ATPase [Spirulina sp. SIO3F2]